MAGAYTLAALECIILSDGCVQIDQLWTYMLDRFGNRADFLSIIGATVDDLERFIKLQPAVFQLRNHCVYSSDGVRDQHMSADPLDCFSPVSHCHSEDHRTVVPISRSAAADMEAVNYFRSLLRKCDRWIHVKSLAGHLSQATSLVRMIVGPQSELCNFLRRHPSVFELQGDLVGLCDQIRTALDSSSFQSCKKRSRPLSFQRLDSPNDVGPPGCFHLPLTIDHTCALGDNVQQCDTVVLSVDECKGVLWLLYNVETSTPTISTSSLLALLSRAPKCVYFAIGRTQIELMEFIKKYNRIFITDEYGRSVAVNAIENLNLVVVMKGSDSGRSNILLAQKGCVYCVNKLWGILDLGFHEHVFFDRSLFKHVTDLSKHFKVRETVLFNAVLAPKGSRAKWRATCVWKETDPLPAHIRRPPLKNAEEVEDPLDDPDSGLDNSDDVTSSKTPLRQLFVDVSEAFDYCSDRIASIRLSYPWELHFDTSSSRPPGDHSRNDQTGEFDDKPPKAGLLGSISSRSSPVSEMSTLSGIPSIQGYADSCLTERTNPPSTVSVSHCSCSDNGLTRTSTSSTATQTLFTGEIMATKLYHEDVGKLV